MKQKEDIEIKMMLLSIKILKKCNEVSKYGFALCKSAIYLNRINMVDTINPFTIVKCWFRLRKAKKLAVRILLTKASLRHRIYNLKMKFDVEFLKKKELAAARRENYELASEYRDKIINILFSK